MRRIAFILAIGVASFMSVLGLATGGLPATAANDPLPKEWSPLSNTCRDVSGDGLVDLPNDILGIILRFNAKWGDDNYALVFDVTGDGVIDLPNDILSAILAYHPIGPNPDCSEVDTQVIRSAVALLPYQDCGDAIADGYTGANGVYVPGMGVHISKPSNLKSTFDPDLWDPIEEEWTDLANPFGLVCSVSPDGGVGKLIGPWYIIPVAATGSLYGVTGIQPNDVPPDGFATGEDYIPYDPENFGSQAGWHTHVNLCVGPGLLAELGSGGTHQDCKNIGGVFVVPLYGWMLHLYNFVPNPAGRFMRWNTGNPDFPRCDYAPTACP